MPGPGGGQGALRRPAHPPGHPQAPGATATSYEGAAAIASAVGYPVVMRPSFVLGGRAMEIVYNEDELKEYMAGAVEVSSVRPVLVDNYMQGMEVEGDAVADGERVVIAGIMEHIERAG